MAEYIEREVLKERFAKRLDWLKCEADMELIDEIPAIDAAVVTLCENCKYYALWSDDRAMNHCDYHDIVVYDEDFCSRAEPKEG